MTSVQYRRKLENQLVTEFIQKFVDKVGYAPTVITDQQVNGKRFKRIPLDELEEVFEVFLPSIDGKIYQLSHKNRSHSLTNLRHIFCFLAKLMGYSLISIGRHLRRDHTTIIHSVRTFRNLYQTNDHFRELYFTVIKKLRAYYESSNLEIPDKMEGES